MGITTQQLNEILARKPIAKRNPSGDTGVRTVEPKSTKGHALASPLPGETESSTGAAQCAEYPRCRRITYIVYAVRPCDWDGYHIKELQDMLVKAGVLDGDEWDILQGQIISQKVFKKEEERTEVFIENSWPFLPVTAQPSG